MSTKPTLVLMAGLPGAGKSTLASELSKILQWEWINKDERREKLLGQGMDEQTAGREAYEWSFRRAYRFAIQGKSAILDSAAQRKFILENVQQIVGAVPGTQLKVILCLADRDLRNNRLRSRTPQKTNIWDDPLTIDEYRRLFKHLPSDTLMLFTDQSLEECLMRAWLFLSNQTYMEFKKSNQTYQEYESKNRSSEEIYIMS